MTVDAALASSESGRQVPVPLGGRSTASGVRPSVECFRRTDASAPPAESSRTPKNFFAKASFTQRLPPLWDRTIFGQVFVRGGMTEFSKWKVPLPGGQARRNKLLVSWGPLVIAPALAGVKNQSEKSPYRGVHAHGVGTRRNSARVPSNCQVYGAWRQEGGDA